MDDSAIISEVFDKYVKGDEHAQNDYIGLIHELVGLQEANSKDYQLYIDEVYEKLFAEIRDNNSTPVEEIKFGTSGWRGLLGKDIFAKSISQVTKAIIQLYTQLDEKSGLKELLHIQNIEEAKQKGCVLGFDNRFGGEFLAAQVAKVLSDHGFKVYYAGESTTGVLSAALLEYKAAFSINLTPSHNPLDYGGYKFNAADGGPAASEITEIITNNARAIVQKDAAENVAYESFKGAHLSLTLLESIDSLHCWQEQVRKNYDKHGLDLNDITRDFEQRDDFVIAVDCVHGASRLHIKNLLLDENTKDNNDRLVLLRADKDYTFGGVAPEPSTTNMKGVVDCLSKRSEMLKVGAIVDPDGDRIRFTDGQTEISMNQFGAMAYHFLHELKQKKGMVAKTVATSNLANKLAEHFGEELFEPSVGFKNFKPVIGKAVVIFEESDGISIIGHTPEKDAYIGLFLAIQMVLVTGKNLGDYLRDIEKEFGAFYPDRDGILVEAKGKELLNMLGGLDNYKLGEQIQVGEEAKIISEIITVDGHKFIFEDGSWLMIRPSGTEPKVRFYVESRSTSGTSDLVAAAKRMLKEVGILKNE